MLGFCSVAAGIGALASASPALGVAALVAAVAVPAAVLWPRLVPPLLAATIAGESLTVHGITVGRLCAPLALIAVVSHVLEQPPRLRHARTMALLVGSYALLAASSVL